MITSEGFFLSFFFQHVGNFHYFGAAVTFGIPGSFSLPFLVPPEETQKRKHLRRVFASSHLLAQKMEATCGLQEQVLCSGTSPQAWRAGRKKQDLILSFRAVWKPLENKALLWMESSERDRHGESGRSLLSESCILYLFFFLLSDSFFPSRIYLPDVSRIREILFIQRVACFFSYLSFQPMPQFWYPGHRVGILSKAD